MKRRCQCSGTHKILLVPGGPITYQDSLNQILGTFKWLGKERVMHLN